MTVLSATTAVKLEPSALHATWGSSRYAFWERNETNASANAGYLNVNPYKTVVKLCYI